MNKQKYLIIALVMLSLMTCNLRPATSESSSNSTSQPSNTSPAQSPNGQTTYMPVVTKNAVSGSGLVQPANFDYLGAFRLPEDGDRPLTFAYGGGAMTYSQAGDSAGAQDGFPGSLFIMGHDRLAYGELPDGNQVAEINIPIPVASKNLGDLPTAEFLQAFSNLVGGQFTAYEELPRAGMLYLDHPATGPKIHLSFGQHMEPDPSGPTHGWFDPNLSTPNFQGTWYIGEQSFYSVNGYIIEIPSSWANQYTQGRPLATGRYKDGGWSGMGPALFAYQPWTDANGTPAAASTHLVETVLLQYQSSQVNDLIEHALSNYQHPDEWEGGAWITTPGGDSAVLFAGTKSTGVKYWYGWANPSGPQFPCIEEEYLGVFPLCRLANGDLCPSEDMVECPGHNDYRGWWSTGFNAQFIFYDPADLAQVATSEMEPWQPQPYAVLDIDEHLFLNPAGIELDMLGSGVQRRYRIGEVAYDRQNNLLYVLEWFADDAKPVVHVWKIR